MTVNALGQNIKVLLNTVPEKNMGLRLGDVLRARVVDLLPDNKAIIEVRGKNLLADLSGLSNTGALSKGSFLDLSVGQTPVQGGATLSLRLLKVSGGEGSGILGSLSGSTGQGEVANLESLLGQLQIPVTNANLRAAQSLSQYGLPVDRATLSSLIRSADLLLGVEDLAAAGIPDPYGMSAPAPGAASLSGNGLPRALQRELATALIQGSWGPGGRASLDQSGLEQILDSMAQRLGDGGDPSAENLFESARSQGDFGPAISGAGMRQAALEALAGIRSAFEATPLDRALVSASAMSDAFRSRGLGAPQVPLNGFPRETLLEALAFLRARGLPASRPLVETVAMGIAREGGDLGATLGAIMASQSGIEPSAGLLQAFSSLGQFLAEHHLDMGNPAALWSQMMDYVGDSGLDLEKSLLNPETASSIHPAESLKGRLLHLAAALREATEHGGGRLSPESERLARDINQAISSLDTMNLAARPTPAFDVTTLQLPVLMDGQLQSGQLSIYWKKGRPHRLDEKDPVNVSFLLNTAALGEVKIQLQVWKNECQCKVSVQEPGNRDFLKESADGLRKGFETNTRFKLSGLDFTSAGDLATLAVRGLGLLEDQPRSGALNLRA